MTLPFLGLLTIGAQGLSRLYLILAAILTIVGVIAVSGFRYFERREKTA